MRKLLDCATDPVFIYPGSFSPPTYGHASIIEQLAGVTRQVIIICSVNEEKDNLFSPEESKELWRSYPLPIFPRIMTLAEFMSANINPSRIVMVRGIRDSQDFDYEKKVAFLNHDNFGLNKFLYIMSDPKFEEISSTAARKAAAELRLADLQKLVSARVATSLLEKTLHIKNLVLATGRPGSGKSTFLRRLSEFDPRNIHINTDEFSRELQPLLRQTFPGKDLAQIALNREEDLKAVIAKPWMEKLVQALRQVPPDSNVFVEIPYAFKPGMNLYKLLGGKTLYFDCGDTKENERRLGKRGTSNLKPFISAIPDWETTKRLADEERILIGRIDTMGTLTQLDKRIEWLATRLKETTPLLPFPNFGNLSGPGVQSLLYRRRPEFSHEDRQHIRNALD